MILFFCIVGCEKKCKLEKFLLLIDVVVLKDWRKECYICNLLSRFGIYLFICMYFEYFLE